MAVPCCAWRVVRDVPCVMCRASDVARGKSIGPDHRNEKFVANENSAKNQPSPFWARPGVHGAS